MELTKEEVLNVAKLAKLSLNEKELAKYQQSLTDIVNMVNELNEIDTDGIDPTYHIMDIKNVFRKDVVKDFKDVKKLIENSKDNKDGYVFVPKVINE
ncbi:MAG: Asp-tRNA(Asn)/Glu-tRNA(Gln) amidotransferase subunit GatC [Clostridia bacterium]|jgi:aspartyl-tRNA(Asn)/glutamyl-tRNA(Gln) amidotransferase subunit C|nr:Asp-tRNA(Asn)/Glu-tRNA(Gln) amidotransferase subunit GatC [Clostridia bacterium]